MGNIGKVFLGTGLVVKYGGGLMKNETELARSIVAHLAWRYRYKLRAYNLVRDNKNASKLLIDLAYCQTQESFGAYYSSKRYIS